MNKLDAQRHAGRINLNAIEAGFHAAHAGVTLKEIDDIVEHTIIVGGCTPAFKGYHAPFANYPYPATACISVNDQVVHSIPGDYKLIAGDVLTIDVGTDYEGWKVDSARTRIVDEADSDNLENKKLVLDAWKVLLAQLDVVKVGCSLLDIMGAGMREAALCELNVFTQFGGHYIGKSVHEGSFIPHGMHPNTEMSQVQSWAAHKLQEGDTICLEPIVGRGSTETVTEADEWTIRTADGSITIHQEHCLIVTGKGYEILC
jgi:methionyl aminopeptidase